MSTISHCFFLPKTKMSRFILPALKGSFELSIVHIKRPITYTANARSNEVLGGIIWLRCLRYFVKTDDLP